MYVGEMLKEWRMNKEEVTLERLLAEASNDHLLWEAERANQELILLYASSPTTAMQHCSVYYIDVI
jgi:hypothetical protein